MYLLLSQYATGHVRVHYFKRSCDLVRSLQWRIFVFVHLLLIRIIWDVVLNTNGTQTTTTSSITHQPYCRDHDVKYSVLSNLKSNYIPRKMISAEIQCRCILSGGVDLNVAAVRSASEPFESTQLSTDTVREEAELQSDRKPNKKMNKYEKKKRSLLRILNPAHPSTVAERQNRQTLVKIWTHKYRFSCIVKPKQTIYCNHTNRKVERRVKGGKHLPLCFRNKRNKKGAGGPAVSEPEHKQWEWAAERHRWKPSSAGVSWRIQIV